MCFHSGPRVGAGLRLLTPPGEIACGIEIRREHDAAVRVRQLDLSVGGAEVQRLTLVLEQRHDRPLDLPSPHPEQVPGVGDLVGRVALGTIPGAGVALRDAVELLEDQTRVRDAIRVDQPDDLGGGVDGARRDEGVTLLQRALVGLDVLVLLEHLHVVRRDLGDDHPGARRRNGDLAARANDVNARAVPAGEAVDLPGDHLAAELRIELVGVEPNPHHCELVGLGPNSEAALLAVLLRGIVLVEPYDHLVRIRVTELFPEVGEVGIARVRRQCRAGRLGGRGLGGTGRRGGGLGRGCCGGGGAGGGGVSDATASGVARFALVDLDGQRARVHLDVDVHDLRSSRSGNCWCSYGRRCDCVGLGEVAVHASVHYIPRGGYALVFGQVPTEIGLRSRRGFPTKLCRELRAGPDESCDAEDDNHASEGEKRRQPAYVWSSARIGVRVLCHDVLLSTKCDVPFT